MPRSDYLFTSELVAEGHPDKICDRISDSIVDAYLAADPGARVAAETLSTTNRIVIAGEVRGPATITAERIEQIARDAVRDDRLRAGRLPLGEGQGRGAPARAVAGHRPGRRCGGQQGRGRRRSGHHVRVRLHRDPGADAGADPARPQYPAGHGARPPCRRRRRISAPTPRARSRCATSRASRCAPPRSWSRPSTPRASARTRCASWSGRTCCGRCPRAGCARRPSST